jgi:Lon protease-like protein
MKTRLFPLPAVVLLPKVVTRLHIFEPRYRQMTEDALADDQLVTVVRLRPGADARSDPRAPIEPIACLGRIINHERLPDGRFLFLLLGLSRVRLVREIDSPTLYRQAEVELLEDVVQEPPDAAMTHDVVELFRAGAGRHGPIDERLAHLLESELSLGILTDILVHALDLPDSVKQAFLAEQRVERRAAALVRILRKIADDRADPGSARSFPPPFSEN